MPAISLSTSQLDLILQADDDRLTVPRWQIGEDGWLRSAEQPLFAVYAGDLTAQCLDASNLRLEGMARRELSEAPDAACCVAVFRTDPPAPALRIEHHVLAYPDTALVECWQTVHNEGTSPCRITRLDSAALDIAPDNYTLHTFTSDWGQEFEPVSAPLAGSVILETRFGRSSKGQHPWFALTRPGGLVLSGSVAWSGNWTFRFEPSDSGGYRFSGGLHDWNFSATLAPGDLITSPRLILVLGMSLDSTAQQYAAVGRRYWYPRNALAHQLPVEWNHWWSYEDADINEAVFLQNVEAAARLGIELCTLDAGWFGPDDVVTHWYEHRGDWHRVNTRRFPHGIRPLADAVHAHGMKFGLWCEIEGLGQQAHLAAERPDFPASRGGAWLGYVCFGNLAAQEWAFETLSRLITDYGCDWLKLDFNLEPGAGCDRTDHGHGSGDGLYAHYQGYYGVLRRLRQAFPDVVLENCASGGLRIDLGMLRQTHLTFLSDPDWPAHHAQVLWGATSMLAPDACLHWSFSEWRGQHPQQTFNPRDPALQSYQLDYFLRLAMLSACGFSQKLPELPGWAAARFAYHIDLYKRQVRRFIRDGILHRLTEQPRRSGVGERWLAVQYSLPDVLDESEHLLFVFRLPGAEPRRAIRLAALQPSRRYRVASPDGTLVGEFDGQHLMTSGLLFESLREEESVLVRLEKTSFA